MEKKSTTECVVLYSVDTSEKFLEYEQSVIKSYRGIDNQLLEVWTMLGVPRDILGDRDYMSEILCLADDTSLSPQETDKRITKLLNPNQY